MNCLLDSPWATGKEAIFSDRESCLDFCLDLMIKEMFHRAKLAKRKSKPGDSSIGNTVNCCSSPSCGPEEVGLHLLHQPVPHTPLGTRSSTIVSTIAARSNALIIY